MALRIQPRKVALGEIGLHPPHRDAILLHREVEPTVERAQARRHVCAARVAQVERCAARVLRRHGPDTRVRRHVRDVGCTAREVGVLPIEAAELRVCAHVAVGLLAGDPAQDGDVVGGEAKGPCSVEVPRKERKADRERDAEPEVRRAEEEVVVAVDWGVEPAWRD